MTTIKKTTPATAFLEAQRDYRAPQHDETGQHRGHRYTSAETILNRAREVLNKHGFALTLGMSRWFEASNHGAQTTMGVMEARAVWCGDEEWVQSASWPVDLFGSATSWLKDGEVKYSMSATQENGSAATYAIRYVLPLLMGQGSVGDDPDQQRGSDSAGRKSAAAGRSGGSASSGKAMNVNYTNAKAAQKAVRDKLSMPQLSQTAFQTWVKKAFDIAKAEHDITDRDAFYAAEVSLLTAIFEKAATEMKVEMSDLEDVPF